MWYLFNWIDHCSVFTDLTTKEVQSVSISIPCLSACRALGGNWWSERGPSLCLHPGPTWRPCVDRRRTRERQGSSNIRIYGPRPNFRCDDFFTSWWENIWKISNDFVCAKFQSFQWLAFTKLSLIGSMIGFWIWSPLKMFHVKNVSPHLNKKASGCQRKARIYQVLCLAIAPPIFQVGR